jgi:hypothetical protein
MKQSPLSELVRRAMSAGKVSPSSQRISYPTLRCVDSISLISLPTMTFTTVAFCAFQNKLKNKLTFVRFIPSIIFESLSEHGDSEYKNQWQDRSRWVQRRNQWDTLENGNHQKVHVWKSLELINQAHRDETILSVLGGPNIVRQEFLSVIFCRVVEEDHAIFQLNFWIRWQLFTAFH